MNRVRRSAQHEKAAKRNGPLLMVAASHTVLRSVPLETPMREPSHSHFRPCEGFDLLVDVGHWSSGRTWRMDAT